MIFNNMYRFSKASILHIRIYEFMRCEESNSNLSNCIRCLGDEWTRGNGHGSTIHIACYRWQYQWATSTMKFQHIRSGNWICDSNSTSQAWYTTLDMYSDSSCIVTRTVTHKHLYIIVNNWRIKVSEFNVNFFFFYKL